VYTVYIYICIIYFFRRALIVPGGARADRVHAVEGDGPTRLITSSLKIKIQKLLNKTIPTRNKYYIYIASPPMILPSRIGSTARARGAGGCYNRVKPVDIAGAKLMTSRARRVASTPPPPHLTPASY